MAIQPSAQYPGQIDITDPAGYPLGKAQNITVPSDGTGTPWEKALVNDLFGFQQSLLGTAGIFPSGNADKWGDSQYLQSCYKLFGNVEANIAALRAADSSELPQGTMVAIIDQAEFFFGEVKVGTVTDDGVRMIVFSDDANKYLERSSAGYTFEWSGTFSPLGGVDAGRFLLEGGTYSSTPPPVSGYRFPEAAKLVGVSFENRGSGSVDISGLAFYADPSPTTPTEANLDHQLTAKVDVVAEKTRFVPVIDASPVLSSPMALAFTARDIEASTVVRIRFVFELYTTGQGGYSDQVNRGDQLGPIEAVGLIDTAERIADNNYLNEPERFDLCRLSHSVVKPLDIGGVQNLQQYSETPTNATWYNLVSTSASLDAADTVLVDADTAPVELTRLLDTSALTQLISDWTAAGNNVLSTGARYVISFYVMTAAENDGRFHMRTVPNTATDPGHGARRASKRPRRVWAVVEAADNNEFKFLEDPTLTYQANPTRDLNWFEASLAPLIGDLADVYIGGFQVDKVDSGTPQIRDEGICMIGDEFLAGIDTYPAFSNAIRTAGNADDVRSLQISRWLEMELQANAFNRGIEGDKLTDMATRWATDITPIATPLFNARYVVIQGGAHDIVEGFDNGDSPATVLAALKVAIDALHALALADDLIPVYLTVTPHPGIYGERNTTRQDYNNLLKTQFPLVVDINQVVESYDRLSMLRAPGYLTDGYNLGPDGKRAVGEFLARQPFWVMPRPRPYQLVRTTSPDTVFMTFNGIQISTGSGSPEGVVAGTPGDKYWNTAPTSGADAEFVKVTGTSNTGWQAT